MTPSHANAPSTVPWRVGLPFMIAALCAWGVGVLFFVRSLSSASLRESPVPFLACLLIGALFYAAAMFRRARHSRRQRSEHSSR